MTTKQLSLFPHQPRVAQDIDKHTSLAATLDLFADYLRLEGKSQHTIKAFRADMNLLAKFSGPAQPVARYLTSDLDAYLNWMEHQRGVPCSRKTYARRVTTLKVYFKWLKSLEAIPHDPALAIRQRSGPAPLSDALNERQIENCLAACLTMHKGGIQDWRPELLFRLLLQTGIKKAEAGRLKLADIERRHPQKTLLVIRHKARNVYKERRIELDPQWLELLARYQRQYQPQQTLFSCTTRNLEYILTDIGKRAEVDFKLSFEVMRWTMAVQDHRAAIDEERIREKLGLSKVSWYETGDKIKRISARLDADA